MKQNCIIKKLWKVFGEDFPKQTEEEGAWLESKLDFAPFRTLSFSLDFDTEIAYTGLFSF